MVTKDTLITWDIKDRLLDLEPYIAKGQTTLVNLSRGHIGKLLYYFYGAHVLNNDDWLTKGYVLLEKVLNTITSKKDQNIFNSTLASGIAGLGFTLEILMKEGFLEQNFDSYLRRIDKFVYEGSIKRIKRGDTDFLHGGVGGFHYLSYRLKKNKAIRRYLEDFVLALDEVAVQYDKDSKYFPNSFMLFEAKPDEVNLGLSHGMTATILVLVNLLEVDILPKLTANLIKQSIRFILKFQNDDLHDIGTYAYFPNSILLGESQYSESNLQKYKGGLRWCYGDLNITHLLYKASQILDNSKWLEVADKTGESTLEIRDIKLAKCHGSLFCHGASGIAYYYKYLYRLSKKQRYMQGYDYWISKAMELQENEVKQNYWTDIADYFLEGFVGSSMILMSELDHEATEWENIWLLN